MGSFSVALLEALLSAGVSPERAHRVVELFDQSIDERYGLHAQVIATKRDLAEMETRLVREMAQTRTHADARLAERDLAIARIQAGVDKLTSSTDSGLAGLATSMDARLADTRADLIKWMLAALTAQTALLLAASKLF